MWGSPGNHLDLRSSRDHIWILWGHLGLSWALFGGHLGLVFGSICGSSLDHVDASGDGLAIL
eukprot:2564986-Karenia_brevis.AAC.1